MENVARIKEKCVGCKSCAQSCPKHCISMVESNEGFWYPSVDEKSCIECKLCLKNVRWRIQNFIGTTPKSLGVAQQK
ncbi:MAG: 4Fe-4S binding protein [Gallintestinimicrobium sp.]